MSCHSETSQHKCSFSKNFQFNLSHFLILIFLPSPLNYSSMGEVTFPFHGKARSLSNSLKTLQRMSLGEDPAIAV